jgi:hypothetical protein
MGYSARYHAFSIIAIFTALAIGIVIGAGFGQDLVSDASEDLEQSLSSDLEEANARTDELETELERERDFGIQLYPPLVDGRLEGERIGVLGFGDLPEELATEIEETIEPTGGELTKVAVLGEAGNLSAAAQARLGRRLGQRFVEGGRLDRDGEELLERFSGRPVAVDDVIFARTPVAGEGEQAPMQELEEGVIEGVRTTGVPSVAVELSTTQPSSVPAFDAERISTVDSLDLTSGKLSAVFALLGSEGNFGIKETADRPLPDLVFPPQGRSAGDRERP